MTDQYHGQVRFVRVNCQNEASNWMAKHVHVTYGAPDMAAALS